MGKKIDSTIKTHWPEDIKIRFLDFCKLREFAYGRVIWTLARMFVDGKINAQEFGREYYVSSQLISMIHTEELSKSRVSGDEAYRLHKDLTNTPNE